MAPVRVGSHERNRCRRVPRAAAGTVLRLSAIVSLFLLCGWLTAMEARAFSSNILVTQNANTRRFSFDLHSSQNHNHCALLDTPEAAKLPDDSKERILSCLSKAGIWDDQNSESSSKTLLLLGKDFFDRPEVFSSLLVTDFGVPVLEAHQTRALVMAALREEQDKETANNNHNENNANDNKSNSSSNSNSNSNSGDGEETTSILSTTKTLDVGVSKTNNDAGKSDGNQSPIDDGSSNAANTKTKIKKYSNKEFTSTVVNEQARRRKQSIDDYNYGLPKDYATIYPKLASELDEYYTFMTQPSTYSQESPIRDATAKVYMNHAKLFLGWCCQNAKTDSSDDNKGEESVVPKEEMSIFAVLPNKEKESADNIIRFVLWLRTRDISVSYEANVLRGIIKLLKFRFAKESTSDPLEGKNTFDDIPIIKEVRKLHRDANQRQRLAPRSSDESKKWITWQDYLGVTQNTKNEVLELIENYEALPPSKRRYAKGDTDREYSLEQIRVAEAYQRYLILAILASIPDRQRTIRELEVGRTLMKDNESGCWVVKHGPGDYKTGKHYGERPAMQLAEELTPAIDDFIERWRPSLKPNTNILLVQSKTGKPMTGNSVFKRVVRCCFKYTGKSVNPHLLRDIIVTHVRETEASEKELEALALYMGHSIQMQRTSYDRRTLSTKVAPAVKLMQTVNKIDGA